MTENSVEIWAEGQMLCASRGWQGRPAIIMPTPNGKWSVLVPHGSGSSTSYFPTLEQARLCAGINTNLPEA